MEWGTLDDESTLARYSFYLVLLVLLKVVKQ